MLSLRLKMLRENKGLSQAALAKELGLSQSTIGNWEAGLRIPGLNKAKQIANYFSVSIDFLLDENEATHFSKSFGFEGLEQEDLEDVAKYVEFLREKRKNK